jgi:signal transduction histidine kinase/DNA-binding NarL/FixJ family response regulator/HAMP domain-containing protein
MSGLNIGTKILLVVSLIFILFTIGLSILIGTTSFNNLTQIKQAELNRTSQILASRIAQMEQNATRAVLSFEENEPIVSEIQLLTMLGPYYADPASYFEADFIDGGAIENADKVYVFQAQLKLIQLLQSTQQINNFSSISFYQLSPFDIVPKAEPVLAFRLDQDTSITLTQFNRKTVVSDQLIYQISTAEFKPPAPDYFDISSAYSAPAEDFYRANNFEPVADKGDIKIFPRSWQNVAKPRSEIVVEGSIPVLQTWYPVKIPMAHPETWEEEIVPVGVALVEQQLSPAIIASLADQLGLDIAFAYDSQLLISSLNGAGITGNEIKLEEQETITLNQDQFNYAWEDIELSNGPTNLQAVVLSPVSELETLTDTLRGQIVQLATITILLVGFIIYISLQYLLNRPLGALMKGVQLISAGDLSHSVKVGSRDEVGQLAAAFNSMADQLRDLIDSLEQRVAARTQRLKTVAELGEHLNAFLDVNQILSELVKQVKENFDYYHAHVYLVDDRTRTLILTAAAGGSGARANFQDNLISLDGSSLIARAARTAEIAWLDDIRHGEDWVPTPLLPDAYAEMAVPIIAEDKVLGVLDVQENRVAGLDEGDASMLRSLANYVAVAINNARLFEQVQQRATELAKANEAAEIARQKAEMANKAKSEFLSNISHELRTPLNGILGYTHVLKENSELTPQQANGLNIIEQSGEHLLTLINDILDLAKIEAKKMELFANDIYLPKFLDNLVEIFRIRAEKKGLFFRYELLSSLAYTVRVDERRLRQIIINLLSNAIRFTEVGGVTFRVIELDKFSQPGPQQTEQMVKLRFEVEDTGVGLTAEAMKKIFDPFEQVREKGHQSVGTGLGLTISQNLAQLMRSQIQVTSKPGQGSKFWLDIRLSVDAQHPASEQQTTRKIKGYKGSRRKILVVDDELYNRTLIVDLLTPPGFEVIEARSGQEALKQTQTMQPDFILMDLRMSEMSGVEATQLIRRMEGKTDDYIANLQPTYKSLKDEVVIIAASASAFDKDRKESELAGCNGFLAKPIKPQELFALLETHLNLEWIYEETSDTLEDTNTNSAKAFVIPPPYEMEILLDLANSGKMRRIREQADYLKEQSPEYEPFANKLQDLAQNFRESDILALIEKYIKRAS